MSDAYIAALHQERSDALAAKLDSRVKAIDAELAIVGATPEDPSVESPEDHGDPSVEDASAKPAPKARRARKAQ